MNGNYRKWLAKLIEAGVDIIDIKDGSKSAEFIFREAKGKGVHLDFWQVCDAVWFIRKSESGIGDEIHDRKKRNSDVGIK